LVSRISCGRSGCTRETHIRFSDTSSRLDEDATVTITGAGYSWARGTGSSTAARLARLRRSAARHASRGQSRSSAATLPSRRSFVLARPGPTRRPIYLEVRGVPWNRVCGIWSRSTSTSPTRGARSFSRRRNRATLRLHLRTASGAVLRAPRAVYLGSEPSGGNGGRPTAALGSSWVPRKSERAGGGSRPSDPAPDGSSAGSETRRGEC
jgi:hypothetical protein